MATTRKRWTIEEDQYLIDHLKNYSHNLQKGFLIASQHLDRTPEAISYRWYTKLSKQTPIFRGDIVIRNFFGDIYTEIPYYITPIIINE